MYVYTEGQNAGQTYKHGCRPDAVPWPVAQWRDWIMSMTP